MDQDELEVEDVNSKATNQDELEVVDRNSEGTIEMNSKTET